MRNRTRRGPALAALSAAAGAAVGAYTAYAAVAYLRYGQPLRPRDVEADDRLDTFLPRYDIVERHAIDVQAPAEITLAAASDADLFGSPAIRAIFRAREMVLGARPDSEPHPRGLVALTKALGWGVLDDVPGRQVIMGAVTQPWKADVRFRAVAAEEFARFSEPGFVKIAWTLRADALDSGRSTFRTETRALATDGTARARFRPYWALFAPGIVLIRQLLMTPVKTEAERRARATGPVAITSAV